MRLFVESTVVQCVKNLGWQVFVGSYAFDRKKSMAIRIVYSFFEQHTKYGLLTADLRK